MKRLSSNLTIILKLFIPLIYIVFFGSILVGSIFVSVNDSPIVGNSLFKIVYALVFFLFVVIIYFTVFKLKRIDADSKYIYINNYVKTFRYPWQDIEKLNTKNFGLFRVIQIIFVAKGSLGKKVIFLPSKPLVKDFFKENPELFDKLDEI